MAKPEVISGTVSATGRLDKALAEASGLSRERVKALLAEDRVTVGGRPAPGPSAKVPAGTAFTIAVPPAAQPEAQPENIPLEIVYEDEHLIVVDKPAGLVVHPAAGNHAGTLVNALLHHCEGRLSGIGGAARRGIVHRIDKDTSGLIVAAKSDIAHEGLARQFKDHTIERAYIAICAGHPRPAAGTVATRIGRSDRNRKKMAVLPPDSTRGKHAVTHYKTLKKLREADLIECRLETVRTHQVRVQLASIGHPLLADPLYGSTPRQLRAVLAQLGFNRQALHAAILGFEHPVTAEKLQFSSEMPPD